MHNITPVYSLDNMMIRLNYPLINTHQWISMFFSLTCKHRNTTHKRQKNMMHHKKSL